MASAPGAKGRQERKPSMSQGRALVMMRVAWIVVGALIAFRPITAVRGRSSCRSLSRRSDHHRPGQSGGAAAGLPRVADRGVDQGQRRRPTGAAIRGLPTCSAEAQRYVVGFNYEDRLAKKKLMDEQGTRERSFLLRVDFDPAKVDDLLGRLGARPWRGERPRVLVLLSIQDTIGRYLLTTRQSPRLRPAGGAVVGLPTARPPDRPAGGLADAEANAAVDPVEDAEDATEPAAVARLASDAASRCGAARRDGADAGRLLGHRMDASG